jgi:hypothetical protein
MVNDRLNGERRVHACVARMLTRRKAQFYSVLAHIEASHCGSASGRRGAAAPIVRILGKWRSFKFS